MKQASQTTSIQFILHYKQDLATAIVTRQYRQQDNVWPAYGQSHFATSVRDTAYHLDHLAQALEFRWQLPQRSFSAITGAMLPN